MHQFSARANFLDRLHIHAAKYDPCVDRRGTQTERDFFAAVQADSRHTDGIF